MLPSAANRGHRELILIAYRPTLCSDAESCRAGDFHTWRGPGVAAVVCHRGKDRRADVASVDALIKDGKIS